MKKLIFKYFNRINKFDTELLKTLEIRILRERQQFHFTLTILISLKFCNFVSRLILDHWN